MLPKENNFNKLKLSHTVSIKKNSCCRGATVKGRSAEKEVVVLVVVVVVVVVVVAVAVVVEFV